MGAAGGTAMAKVRSAWEGLTARPPTRKWPAAATRTVYGPLRLRAGAVSEKGTVPLRGLSQHTVVSTTVAPSLWRATTTRTTSRFTPMPV
jgi:hypothetical protein